MRATSRPVHSHPVFIRPVARGARCAIPPARCTPAPVFVKPVARGARCAIPPARCTPAPVFVKPVARGARCALPPARPTPVFFRPMARGSAVRATSRPVHYHEFLSGPWRGERDAPYLLLGAFPCFCQARGAGSAMRATSCSVHFHVFVRPAARGARCALPPARCISMSFSKARGAYQCFCQARGLGSAVRATSRSVYFCVLSGPWWRGGARCAQPFARRLCSNLCLGSWPGGS